MADFIKLDKEDQGDKKRRTKYKFKFRTFVLIFITLLILSSLISSISFSLTPKIAIVPINGVITTSEDSFILSQSTTSSRYIAQTLIDLSNDNTVKAVLLDINSPGGSPVASEEISNAIDIVKSKNITVYALINDVGASGGFWVAVSANKVYASSMSTVGSIGVTSAGLSFENFIKEYNITYRKQTAGEFKDMGSPYRKPTQKEEEKIQNILDEVHSNFITHVAKERNMTYDEVKEYATGEIFLGSTAKEIGFIDEIGYYPNVITEIKNEVGDITIVNYGPEPTFAQALGLKSLFNFDAKSQIQLQ